MLGKRRRRIDFAFMARAKLLDEVLSWCFFQGALVTGGRWTLWVIYKGAWERIINWVVSEQIFRMNVQY